MDCYVCKIKSKGQLRDHVNVFCLIRQFFCIWVAPNRYDTGKINYHLGMAYALAIYRRYKQGERVSRICK